MSATTIAESLRSAALRRPDHLAYAYDQLEHSWAETDRRVDRLANALMDEGIGKGDVIASCCMDGPVLLEIIFAAARIGAIRVGLNYRYAPSEMARVIAHCSARLVVVQDDFAPLMAELPADVRVLSCGDGQKEMADYAALLESGAARAPGVTVGEEDVAQICYTTGSTGVPKAAVWTHRNYMHSTSHTQLDLGMHKDDVWMHCLPGAGVPCLLDTWNAVTGFTNVIIKAFDPVSCLRRDPEIRRDQNRLGANDADGRLRYRRKRRPRRLLGPAHFLRLGAHDHGADTAGARNLRWRRIRPVVRLNGRRRRLVHAADA